MPYIASNNGLTVIWYDPSENHQPQAGEVVFDVPQGSPEGSNPTFPTPAELRQHFAGYDAAVAARDAELSTPPLSVDLQKILAEPSNVAAIKKALGL